MAALGVVPTPFSRICALCVSAASREGCVRDRIPCDGASFLHDVFLQKRTTGICSSAFSDDESVLRVSFELHGLLWDNTTSLWKNQASQSNSLNLSG